MPMLQLHFRVMDTLRSAWMANEQLFFSFCMSWPSLSSRRFCCLLAWKLSNRGRYQPRTAITHENHYDSCNSSLGWEWALLWQCIIWRWQQQECLEPRLGVWGNFFKQSIFTLMSIESPRNQRTVFRRPESTDWQTWHRESRQVCLPSAVASPLQTTARSQSWTWRCCKHSRESAAAW